MEWLLFAGSFVSTSVFGLVIVIILNYAIHSWENLKVDDLTSRIVHSQKNILNKSSVNRGFTSFDLSRSLPKKIQERALVVVSEKSEYPEWIKRTLKEIDFARKNLFSATKKMIAYLFSLSKPAEIVDYEKEDEENKKKGEVDHVIQKVSNISQKKAQSSLDKDFPLKLEEPTKENDSIEISNAKNQDMATIGIAASASKITEQSKDSNSSVFEKLESRILLKLKDSGLENYDIWLELGELYVKFEEKEKAKEIFALILKHSHGKQKEIARDKLIGL
jgi:hypothetical protein